MSSTTSSDRFPLEQLRIASPCDASWDEMTGDDRMRHCEDCGLNVYSLSDLTRAEAEAIVREHASSGKRLCMRMYRRADGTVITRDCPRGLAALKARARRGWQRAVAAAFFLISTTAVLGVVSARDKRDAESISDLQPFTAAKNAVNPAPPPPPVAPIPMGRCVMGDIALPTPNKPINVF